MVIGPDGCGFDMRSPSEMEADDARREADEAAHAPRMAVTSRIRRVAQPPDGYLPLSLFDEVRLADPVPLYAFEDVPADVTGLAVDYLSRVARGVPVLLQCLFDRFGSVFPQCGLMVFPGAVIVSR